MKRFLPLAALLSLFGLLAGCTSYEAQVDRGRPLTGVHRFFVLTSPNDGHGLDHQIAAALTNRGHQAETGPVTMLPEDSDAIVVYQDHWTWDFGDHLLYLQITVRDRKSSQSYGTVTFSAKVPTSKPPAEIADELVGKLFAKP